MGESTPIPAAGDSDIASDGGRPADATVPEVDRPSDLPIPPSGRSQSERAADGGAAASDETAESPLGSGIRRRLPESIGPFTVLELLGVGGMGAVYLGKSDRGQVAAVKVLPASLTNQPGLAERFDREIDALGKVKSDHIVRLLGRGSEEVPGGGEILFYAMEYVAGETLADRIGRVRRVPWREVIEIGVQVCRALKAAHNAGIVHRDLKPSNLLLANEADGGVHVKLTDFGVAQVFATGRLTVTGGMVGTAEYMSPEQADGRRVTKQSDLYSLGAVLYAALVGRPPFGGTNPIDVAQKHRAGLFDSPQRVVPEIPRWLDEVVCQCLEKKPEDRPPDAYVLERRLAEIPRKVELAESDATRVPSVPVQPLPDGEVGGTFVAQMVRDEIERTHRAGTVSRLLDNTFVLVGLLAAVLGVAYLAVSNRSPNFEAEFERGVALLRTQDRDNWRRAIDIFEPIRESGDPKWAARIEPYRDRLAAAALLRAAKRRRALDSASTEPHRILLAARELIDLGQFEEAGRLLDALQATIEPDDSEFAMLVLVQDLQAELAEERLRLNRDQFLASRFSLARRLEGTGQLDRAASILAGLRSLYPDLAIDRLYASHIDADPAPPAADGQDGGAEDAAEQSSGDETP